MTPHLCMHPLLVPLSSLAVLLATPPAAAEVFEDYGTSLVDPFAGDKDFIAVAVGDFNGDSIPDVGGALRFKDLAVLLQDRHGSTWHAHQPQTEDHDSDYGSAVAGDLNGDEVDDVVVEVPHCTLRVVLGSWSGEPRQVAIDPSAQVPCRPGLADLNADGILDIYGPASSGYSESADLVYLPGAGDGTFGYAVTVPVPNEEHAFLRSVRAVAGDFDGDDYTDLAVAASHQDGIRLTVLLGRDGAFVRAWTGTFSDQAADLKVCRIDGDNRLEIALACVEGPDPWLIANGAVRLFQLTAESALLERAALSTPDGIFAVSSADLSGDGLGEIIAASPAGRLHVWRQKAPWEFELVQSCIGAPYEFALADIDGDGNVDAVFPGSQPYGAWNPMLLRGRGDGTFRSPEVYYQSEVPDMPVALGDLDADEVPDLVRVEASFGPAVTIRVLKGDGGGGFLHPASVTVESEEKIIANECHLGDLDGDGHPDLVLPARTIDQESALAVFHGTSSALFGPPRFSDVWALFVELHDVDGDGRHEIIAQAGTKSGSGAEVRIVVLKEDDSGALELLGTYGEGLRPQAVGVTDVDGDRITDLLTFGTLPDPPGGALRPLVFLGRGDGTFGDLRKSEPIDAWPIGHLTACDWNGDAKADLMFGWAYAPGNGDGTFGPAVSFGPDLYGAPEALADLDLDGNLDLVLGGDSLRVLFGAGGGGIARTLTARGPTAWFVFAADLDRNGAPDVITAGRLIAVYRNTTPAPERAFSRGDASGDGELNLTDPIHTLNYLFLGGPAAGCLDAADSNDSGELDITDAVYTLGFLFLGGPEPAAPFPLCGLDPTPDGLGCVEYGGCGG